MTKQQIKPVTVRIDVELWHEVSIAAAIEDRPIRHLVEDALRGYLKAHHKEGGLPHV